MHPPFNIAKGMQQSIGHKDLEIMLLKFSNLKQVQLYSFKFSNVEDKSFDNRGQRNELLFTWIIIQKRFH